MSIGLGLLLLALAVVTILFNVRMWRRTSTADRPSFAPIWIAIGISLAAGIAFGLWLTSSR